jgi:YVTN family beta-propeller protein
MKSVLLFMTAFFFFVGSPLNAAKHVNSDGVKKASHKHFRKHHYKNTKAFFGDKELNRVVIADIEEMEPSKPEYDAFTGHEITYAVDKVPNKPRAYISNRGSDAIDIINTRSNKIIKTIKTEHYPRSADAMNVNKNLCEVSGMDKAMASIIDTNTNKIVAVVGPNIEKDPDKQPDKGGSHATGHPYWLNDTMFVIVDRFNSKLVTCRMKGKKAVKVNEVQTLTSVHQLIPRKGYHGPDKFYYAVEEGSNTEYPGIIKLKLSSRGLKIVDRVFLKKDDVDVKDMKGHHGDFHPFQKLIYVGSAEGNLFMVNYKTMQIEKIVSAGKGAGHTFMSPEKRIAVVINHSDVFVSIFDLDTNTKISDARVSEADDLVGEKTLQAHPGYYISGNKFYMALTEEGKIIELDLDTYEVTRSVEFGGKIAMGAFVEHK